MNTLRVRLTFGVLGVMLFSLLALFLFYQYLSARTLENEIEKRLAQDSALMLLFLDRDPPDTFAALEDRLKEAAHVNEIRLWLYAPKGVLLFDSAGFSGGDSEGTSYDQTTPPTEEYVISGRPWVWKGKTYELIVGYEKKLLNTALLPTKLWGFLGFMLASIFVALSVFRIAKGMTRPLTRITEVARSISEARYGTLVDVSGYGEIATLAQAINAMSRSLEENVRRIRENEKRLSDVLANMTSGVLLLDRDGIVTFANRAALSILQLRIDEVIGFGHIQALKHYELSKWIDHAEEVHEPLRHEMMLYFPVERVIDLQLVPLFNEADRYDGLLVMLHDISEIRRLERIRSEFVANASHELKTPVTSIQGFAETLLDGAVEDPREARAFAEIIYRESERLKRLIQDILDLSKIEQRRVPFEYRDVHLATLIADVFLQVEKSRQEKSIAIRAYVDDDLTLETDCDRLKQILLNLVINGIQYTPPGGYVAVYGEYDGTSGDDVLIRVEDNGIGIPQKDLSRVFERFYRVDKARSRNSGGTGLGLAIVKHLVEMMEGTIWVESIEGKGTTFYVRLPRERPHSADHTVKQEPERAAASKKSRRAVVRAVDRNE
ncbi:MAG: HAMP domain-containing protein [Candidatus Carbobacillus altaicus]|nr:HAMP domain-containing protein [Candidatus Carbobacillus altaicus]